MKIIGGKSKGRRIDHDRSEELRPTSAKVRESVFNIIQDRIEGAGFLDLYAGSGAVGIEAASRGATEAVLVESDPERAKRIRDLASSFSLSGKVTVVCDDVLHFLSGSGGNKQFDIIFADPPYKYEKFNELFKIIYNMRMVSKNGILLIEHASRRELLFQPGCFVLLKQYRYGDTMISKFRRSDEQDCGLPGDV